MTSVLCINTVLIRINKVLSLYSSYYNKFTYFYFHLWLIYRLYCSHLCLIAPLLTIWSLSIFHPFSKIFFIFEWFCVVFSIFFLNSPYRLISLCYVSIYNLLGFSKCVASLWSLCITIFALLNLKHFTSQWFTSYLPVTRTSCPALLISVAVLIASVGEEVPGKVPGFNPR